MPQRTHSRSRQKTASPAQSLQLATRPWQSPFPASARRRARRSFRIAPAPFLTLPAVGRTVYREIPVGEPSAEAAPIVDAFIDAGLITRKHFRRDFQSPELALTRCLGELTTYVSKISAVDIAVAVAADVEFISDFGFDASQWFERHSHRCPKSQLKLAGSLGAFAIRKDGPHPVTIGPVLEHYEQSSPGLGQAILESIRDHMWDAIPIYCPEDAYDAAREYYWHGEENEHLGQVNDEELVTSRQDWQRNIPDWAIKPVSMDDADFTAAINSVLTPQNAVFFDAVNKFRHLPKTENHYPWFERTSFYSTPIVLRWQKQDCGIGRIFDDLCNGEYQGGDTELSICWMHCFDTGKPASILKALQALRNVTSAIQLLNTILAHLGDRKQIQVTVPLCTRCPVHV